jgi:hypothetical protein
VEKKKTLSTAYNKTNQSEAASAVKPGFQGKKTKKGK